MADEVLLVKKESLESVADAIREKGGTSAALAFPSGFVNAIGAINGGNTFPYTSTAYMYYGRYGTQNPQIPGGKIAMDLPYCRRIDNMFSSDQGSGAPSNESIFEVELTLYAPAIVQAFANRNKYLKKIVFPNGITIYGNCRNFTDKISVVESIIGEIAMASDTELYVGESFIGPKIKDITFAKNTIYGSLQFQSVYLTDASLISICNGLNESMSSKTLTMPDDIKTRMASILGTVTLDSALGCHVFTANVFGETTLTDFVTNTKGWTLA